jgi:hypothetical protein
MMLMVCDAHGCRDVQVLEVPDQVLDGWRTYDGNNLCPVHSKPEAQGVATWMMRWLQAQQKADDLSLALDKVWHIVRTYDRSPDVSVKVLKVLESLE